MDSKQRLLQYLDYKGISKYAFYKKTGLSNGFLDKNSNIGSDKLDRIIKIYSDINLLWLITGSGEMINVPINVPVDVPISDTYALYNSNTCPPGVVCQSCSLKDSVIAAKEQVIAAQKQTIASQAHTIELLTGKSP